MNRFTIIESNDDYSCIVHVPEFYILDRITAKFIVSCMDKKTAEMVCLALNYAQNEGLL